MGINYSELRSRLLKLKTDNGLNNYEFCKIYAPDKCGVKKSTVENYISAIFSGRDYPKSTSGPIYPELDHLQNLVDSCKFPGLTMNYLLYGDDSPVVENKTVDLNLEQWSLADLCEFIGNLKMMYPNQIEIREDVEAGPSRWDDECPPDETYQKRYIVITIEEMDDIDKEPGRTRFSIGQALSLFHYDTKDIENIRDEEIRRIGLKKVVKEIRERDDFSNTNLVDCDRKSPFFIAYGE